jgi:hypothetical protein
VRDKVWFTHNDSGDEPRFFAVDDRGCTLAAYNLLGADDGTFASAHDVEDIARGPLDGHSTIWLADIGDNNYGRTNIAVYAIDEPNSNSSANRANDTCRDPASQDVSATRYALAYETGPQDAETLLADPVTGQLFVVTKTPLGHSSVYAAPSVLDPDAVNTLTLVGAIAFPPTTTFTADPTMIPGDSSTQAVIDVTGRLWATGGDIAADRSRVVVRTYTDAFEWSVPVGASIAEVLTATLPLQIPLKYDRQGEAIAYAKDGSALVTTSEYEHSTAHIYART